MDAQATRQGLDIDPCEEAGDHGLLCNSSCWPQSLALCQVLMPGSLFVASVLVQGLRKRSPDTFLKRKKNDTCAWTPHSF